MLAGETAWPLKTETHALSGIPHGKDDADSLHCAMAEEKQELVSEPTDTASQADQTEMRLGAIMTLAIVMGLANIIEGSVAMTNASLVSKWGLLITGQDLCTSGIIVLMCIALPVMWCWERLRTMHTYVHVFSELSFILLTATLSI